MATQVTKFTGFSGLPKQALPIEVCLVSISLPSEDSLELVFTNWPQKDEILEGIKKRKHPSTKDFEDVVKKATISTHRKGRVECGGMVIEKKALINNDRRGSDYHR